MRAVEHRKCAVGLFNAHHDYQVQIFLNYTTIENAHEARKKTFNFLLFMEVAQIFCFPFSVLRCYQMPECFYVNNCCF